ncbi:uncharacterized protein LOC105834023 isoform X3 [Monomorium pharaonis]|uniref:uncharacterized protein LOC105834023 isoform X3 n=1 Tax=Monomorium pharaonis TaxID=307658 RepID=UPI00174719F5|nr:uncharacterized protein LOC105834023 isoform X3 [Monomorium pharaonis]
MRGGAGDGEGPSVVTVPASTSLNLITEDSMSDDVFEMDDDRSSTVVSGGLTPATIERPLEKTPSPTGYRDYKPPAEVLGNNYSTTFKTTSDFDSVKSALKRDQQREDNFAHKTILLGDSGVGKTSLLVQFDTGRFQPGNFAATVGIGFTVSPRAGHGISCSGGRTRAERQRAASRIPLHGFLFSYLHDQTLSLFLITSRHSRLFSHATRGELKPSGCSSLYRSYTVHQIDQIAFSPPGRRYGIAPPPPDQTKNFLLF